MERLDTDTPAQVPHFAAWSPFPAAAANFRHPDSRHPDRRQAAFKDVVFDDVPPDVLAREEVAASSWLAFLARTLPAAHRLRTVS